MKFKNSFVAAFTVLSVLMTSCATTATENTLAEIPETPESPEIPEKNKAPENTIQTQSSPVKNYEQVENKINRISELKIVHLPEKPGQ